MTFLNKEKYRVSLVFGESNLGVSVHNLQVQDVCRLEMYRIRFLELKLRVPSFPVDFKFFFYTQLGVLIQLPFTTSNQGLDKLNQLYLICGKYVLITNYCFAARLSN